MIENLPALVIATLTPDGVSAEDAEALAVPVALSGAFFLPEGMFAEDGWMVTGLVIDPDVRRGGIGRAVLAELVRQVGALQPGAVLQTFVDATHHAALAMHLSVGFQKVEERRTFAGMEMPDGGVVLAVVCPG
nr:GNAT family N-acetyltransferase [Actinomyces sp. 186855]